MQGNIKSIREFNATGDGVTDDTSAIKQAAESGEAIFFPPGTYILNEQIDLSGVDIHWYGAGDLSTIKLMPADTSRKIFDKDKGKNVFKTSMLFIEDGGELEFHNIKFDANKDSFKEDILQNGSTSDDHVVCIEIYGSKRLVLDGVTIVNALIEGVYVYRTQNISVTRSKFIGNGYCESQSDASGMQIGGGYKRPPAIIISNSEFHNNGFNGLLLNGVYGAVVNNIVCNGNGYDGVALWGGSSHCTLSNIFCSKNRAGLNLRRNSGPGYDEIAKNAEGAIDEENALYRYTSNIIVNGLVTIDNRFGILWGCARDIYVNGWIGEDTFNHGVVYLEENEDISGYITGTHLTPTSKMNCENYDNRSDISKFKVRVTETELPKGWLLWHRYSNYDNLDSELFLRTPNGMIKNVRGNFFNAMNGNFGKSPKQFTFMARDKTTGDWDIYLYNEGEIANLTQKSGFQNEDPKFSPDGKTIVFKRRRWNNDVNDFVYDLALLDVSTKAVTMLTDDSAEEAMPYFSEDGKYIYYASFTDHIGSICRLDLSTKTSETIFSENGVCAYYPIVSGDKLYFTKWYSADNKCDQIMCYDGKTIKSLPFNSDKYDCSDSCPIGDEKMVFSSTMNGGYDLYYYNGLSVSPLTELNSDKDELGADFFAFDS